MKITLLILLYITQHIYSQQPEDCNNALLDNPVTDEKCRAVRPLNGECCGCVAPPHCEGCEEVSCPPTSDPTMEPTSQPTHDPTMEPTREPTMEPTSQPTHDPTMEPTIVPTIYPTKVTMQPTINVINPTIDVINPTINFDNNFIYITIIIAGVFILILMIGYAHKKYIRKNDFFRASFICAALFQVLDLSSDIFLSVNIKGRAANDEIDLFFILWISSLTFIIMPIMISIGQLLHQIQKRWWNDDYIKLWLTKNNKLLYFLSILTGSSFTAVGLMNSNLLSKSTFSMGLTDIQYTRFQAQRVYSIVLLENLPQVILQSIYLWKISQMDSVAVASMLFSLISIIVTIISMMTEKNILNSTGYAVVEFNVTGSAVVSKANSCKYKVINIRNQLASILGIKNELMEVMRPNNIPNGFKITMQIHINRIQIRDINYEKLLNNCQQSGNLAGIFENVWKLESTPNVSTITFKVQESKKWKKSMVSIQVNSDTDANNVQSGSERFNSIECELAPIPQVKMTPFSHVNDNESSDSSVNEPYGNGNTQQDNLDNKLVVNMDENDEGNLNDFTGFKKEHTDEDLYCQVFETKPLGIVFGKNDYFGKEDTNNLYVAAIDDIGDKNKENVIIGSKIIKVQDEHVEDIGYKKIYKLFATKYVDTLPLKITFSKPNNSDVHIGDEEILEEILTETLGQ